MPKLLIFAPCEKVINNQDDNTTSLITLLEAINLPIRKEDEEKVPEDANIPLKWSVLALWRVEPEDEGRAWEQRFVVELPTGEEAGISAVMGINFEPEKPNYRNVINVFGLPIKQLLRADTCIMKLFYRPVGEQEWRFVADFTVLIRRVIPEPKSE